MPISKPNQGDPTKKSLIDDIIDLLTSHGADIATLVSLGLLSNGSFEVDDDADNVPDGWDWTAQTGGTKLIDDTTSAHGIKSFKITSTGGGNGGGHIQNSSFAECSPNQPLLFRWQTKSSVAGIKNMVEIRWYSDADEGDYISTTTLWTEDTANPTSWQLIRASTTPPSTARYFKMRLTGADSSDTTAGSAWFDDVGVELYQYTRKVEFTVAGATTFIAPVTGVYRLTLAGAGGGGGSGGGGGGGGGERAVSWRNLVAGTEYSLTVGTGGAAGTSNSVNGSAGTDSTWETSVVVAKGGAGGKSINAGALGGAGGTGGTGTILNDGEAGRNGTSASSAGTGKGGDSYHGGYGAKVSLNGFRGGGGGGDGSGVGGNGVVTIEW